MSFERLDRRLSALARRLVPRAERLIANVVTEIGKELVPATPVKTGYARGNWQVTINAPAAAPISVLDPTGAATIARIAAVAQLYRSGGRIYLANLAPYIGLLNAGSSPQATAMFVQRSVEKGTRKGVAAFRLTDQT